MKQRKITVTADAVVIENNKILLIKRKNTPFRNTWALPGGLVDYGETVEECCLRELKEETCLEGEIQKLIGVYSEPNRDPRGHTITIAFLTNVKKGEPQANDDALELKWFNLQNLPKLAFDHLNIIEDALSTKNQKI